MASATKVQQGATHSFEAKRDCVVLLLTPQEANWLQHALQRASEHTQSMENQMIVSRIKDALTPVTGCTPS